MSEGIAADMFFFLTVLVGGGKAVTQNYTSLADGGANGVTGTNHKIGETIDHWLPALTVVNNGTAKVFIGVGGVPAIPLGVGSSMTFRWKNPRKLNLVFNDGGTAASIAVFG